MRPHSPSAHVVPLIVALLLGGGCATIGGAPAGEVAELVAEGGTKPLREELRPIRGTTRVLVFALDGVGHDDLHRALRDGRMPRTAALLGPAGTDGVFRNAYSVPEVVSVLPSNTIPGWTSLFTGAPPAETGVPGNEWWARDEAAFHAPAPGSVSSKAHAVRMYTDELLGKAVRVPTLFERAGLRSHVSMLQLHRGADLLQLAPVGRLGDLFERVAEDAVTGGGPSRGTYRETDQTAASTVLSDLEKHGIPDLQVVYLAGTDLIPHHAPDPLRVQQQYLEEVVDPIVSDVLDAYADGGALEDTYVLIVSDHGHTPVLGDDRHALGTDGDDEPPAVLERAGFRVRPAKVATDRDDFQAVLAYQGAAAYVYLADRSTCPAGGDRCDWSRPPRTAEDLLPAARAFHAASATGAGVPALRGTLDLVLARLPGTQELRVFDGAGLVPVREYLARHPRPELLRLEERLRWLTRGPHADRAGDLVLLARTGAERPIEERFYFGEEGYHSWHGGAAAQDSRVPLVVAHPRKTGARIREETRRAVGPNPSHLDFTPLVLELLGVR
ncbi:MAG TPA: alkaline phosphatase family protein [Longimicrobiaceae bacterium]|nr:alkaline phosphatase family protein [Longimicrobiaceae bacterium]